MRNPFFRSAGPVFVDRDEVLGIARDAARGIAASDPSVLKVILFGSFVRSDYGPRSDVDLLIVLKLSDKPARERLGDFSRHIPPFPIDLFAYTQTELDERLASGEPFLIQAISEGVVLFPEDG